MGDAPTTACKYSGADWLKNSLGVKLPPLGVEVADIVGQVMAGLYHVDGKDLRASEWSDPHCVVVRLWGSLSTWDFDRLTVLVVLCHDRAIRLEISARARGYLELTFHRRQRSRGIGERHPTMEAAIDTIRASRGLGVVEEVTGA